MKINDYKIVLLIFLSIGAISLPINAQVYTDLLAGGNKFVFNSSTGTQEYLDIGPLCLSETVLFPDLAGASRFLAQAGFGGNYQEIKYLTQIGIEAWLEEQFSMPSRSYFTTYQATYEEVVELIHTVYPQEDIVSARNYVDFVFWEKVFKDADVLRNKAAFALNQIFVLSTRNSKFNGHAFGGADYYDILYEGAFGNFRDLLQEVTLHPMMGYYLSHLHNKKADLERGTFPDENYAREIMQLFTIGLNHLHNDGTYQLDQHGNRIPVYDITDIQELARVFTGLSGGAWDTKKFPHLVDQELIFGKSFNNYDMTVPMMMWEQHHDRGMKVMINGKIIPAGQSGMQDIHDALDVLFHHPNVGPFIAIRLIQQLVKSNPSPAYINRVATVFNDNGKGIRGDLRAVFRAILIDSEARSCEWMDHPKTGKLRQPLERLIGLCRGFKVNSPSGRLWMSDSGILFDEVEQTFMGAPTVFNFFHPFYAEDEYVASNNMVSPAFQILHSVTAIHYLNTMEEALKGQPFRNYTKVNPTNPWLTYNEEDTPYLDFSEEIALFSSKGLDALLDRLDLIVCHGQLSDGSKTIIANALREWINSGSCKTEDVVPTALYFIVASADYTILK
ncbi:MAG: DUF1800 family protein [Bacteroidota bacterium]